MSVITKTRVPSVVQTLVAALIALLVASDSAAGSREPASQGAGAPGPAKGFVRVNGGVVTVAHAVAVVAPDSYDPSKPVTLVLVTSTPLLSAAVTKAANRSDVYALVAQGAIVEIRESGHDVVIIHKALGKDRVRTGGQSEFDTANPARAKGSVQTFMPGDSEEFGFKVRYEIAFDAPIVKRLPLAAPTAETPGPSTKPSAPAKPAAMPTSTPKTAAEARKWLEAAGLPAGPTPSDALAFYLTLGNDLSAAAVRAYLVFGASATKPGALTKDYPLNALAVQCEGKAAAGEVAEMLLAAGAEPNQMEPDGRKASPAMAAVICPDVLKAILARKPNLDVVDANGLTAMHYALRFGKPRDVAAKMLMEAGFPLAKWRTSLLEQVDDDGEKLIRSFNGAAPGAKPAAAPPRGTPTRTPPAAIDWKALGPYPSRSKAEAAKLLHKPGADNDPTESMFDALRESEPQRLAVAIQAGADVRVVREGSLMSPLHFLAWQCEADDDPALQLSLVEQLLAAGADVKVVDTTKETPLISAADDCTIGMVKALIAAGSPVSAVSSTGQTALKAAILDGRADVVEALIDAGVDPRKEPYNVNKFTGGNKAVEAALRRRRR